MRKLNSTNTLNEQEILEHCGVSYTLSLIGGRWKANILWALLRNKRLRYNHFRKIIPGVSERMLAQQLREMETDRLIRRIVYAEVPPRTEYELTALGHSMEPMMVSIAQWGEIHRNHVKEQDNGKSSEPLPLTRDQ